MPTTAYGHHLRTCMEEYTGTGFRPCPSVGCLNVTPPDLIVRQALCLPAEALLGALSDSCALNRNVLAYLACSYGRGMAMQRVVHGPC